MKLTLPNVGKAAMYGTIAVLAGGLTIRYFGDQPIIKDAKEGLKGNVIGLFR